MLGEHCMNMNLGAPYEAIIQKLINREYAGNQTEVVRQALVNYERTIAEEEAILVHRAVEAEMEKIRSGEKKTYTLEEVKKRFKW
ncbi:hypothetical protein HY571_00505 [Candidatus Micrarchaeota archaeon]|nr:hypothetical protein [Candidatus Micrarchaeota archaeon]